MGRHHQFRLKSGQNLFAWYHKLRWRNFMHKHKFL